MVFIIASATGIRRNYYFREKYSFTVVSVWQVKKIPCERSLSEQLALDIYYMHVQLGIFLFMCAEHTTMCQNVWVSSPGMTVEQVGLSGASDL